MELKEVSAPYPCPYAHNLQKEEKKEKHLSIHLQEILILMS